MKSETKTYNKLLSEAATLAPDYDRVYVMKALKITLEIANSQNIQADVAEFYRLLSVASKHNPNNVYAAYFIYAQNTSVNDSITVDPVPDDTFEALQQMEALAPEEISAKLCAIDNQSPNDPAIR
ncbi:MAG UNVERIFIED_CONTAM: hypothetical protein LVQ98_09175 [Rickettsiaceae bacterium]